MAIYCISYDPMLPFSTAVYKRVSEYLKTYEHSTILEYLWLIETEKLPEVISTELQGQLDRNDEALIIRVTKEFSRIGCKDARWLVDPGRKW